MTATKTYTEWRIMSKAPGDARWKWRRFTGAGPHRSLEHARRGLRWAHDDSHAGWEFRIEGRQVTVATTPWRPLPVRKATA